MHVLREGGGEEELPLFWGGACRDVCCAISHKAFGDNVTYHTTLISSNQTTANILCDHIHQVTDRLTGLALTETSNGISRERRQTEVKPVLLQLTVFNL